MAITLTHEEKQALFEEFRAMENQRRHGASVINNIVKDLKPQIEQLDWTEMCGTSRLEHRHSERYKVSQALRTLARVAAPVSDCRYITEDMGPRLRETLEDVLGCLMAARAE